MLIGHSQETNKNTQNQSTRNLQLNAYGDFNDLPRRTVSGKVLRDKAFKIVNNPTQSMMGINAYSHQLQVFLIKKSGGANTQTGTGTISEDQQLGNESHKPYKNWDVRHVLILSR